MTPLEAMRAELTALPGVVSIWYGRVGAPARFALAEHAAHYAASTMKLAVLAALHRRVDADLLRLADEVPVRNEFASAAPGAPVYACRRGYDSDEAVWARLGETAPLGWLAERMIVRSSNLATNIILARVGLPAVAEVWPLVGARASVVQRGIEDSAAAEAGLTNLVSAADLAALLSAIAAGGPLVSPAASAAMLDTLLAQEWRVDLAAGLPPGTRVAHKNGWIDGVRHSAGVVFPDDAPPFVLTVCATTPLATGEQSDEACQIIARIATAAWLTARS